MLRMNTEELLKSIARVIGERSGHTWDDSKSEFLVDANTEIDVSSEEE